MDLNATTRDVFFNNAKYRITAHQIAKGSLVGRWFTVWDMVSGPSALRTIGIELTGTWPLAIQALDATQDEFKAAQRALDRYHEAMDAHKKVLTTKRRIAAAR